MNAQLVAEKSDTRQQLEAMLREVGCAVLDSQFERNACRDTLDQCMKAVIRRLVKFNKTVPLKTLIQFKQRIFREVVSSNNIEAACALVLQRLEEVHIVNDGENAYADFAEPLNFDCDVDPAFEEGRDVLEWLDSVDIAYVRKPTENLLEFQALFVESKRADDLGDLLFAYEMSLDLLTQLNTESEEYAQLTYAGTKLLSERVVEVVEAKMPEKLKKKYTCGMGCQFRAMVIQNILDAFMFVRGFTPEEDCAYDFQYLFEAPPEKK